MSDEKMFSMILRLKMVLSVVFYKKERTLYFMKRILNLRKIMLLIMFIVIHGEKFVKNYQTICKRVIHSEAAYFYLIIQFILPFNKYLL